ncbi:MAG: hypothetical protein HYX62_02150 [Gammaproteobacteria bacterium]|nr:hypothetical protein [Gammaproteobacteria bacterium]
MRKIFLENIKNSGLSTHILPTSATLVGACITAVSLVKLMHLGRAGFFVDKLLALTTIMFLASAIVSFMSMRVQRLERRLESLAEMVFLVALGFVAIAAVVNIIMLNLKRQLTASLDG